MRYSEEVMKMVWEKYVPRLASEPEEEQEQEQEAPTTVRMGRRKTPVPTLGPPDPNCLYVGPFLDGIGIYLPEMFRIPFPTTAGPEHARRHLKSMLADTLPGDRARNLTTKELRITMTRDTWTPDARSGRVPTVILNDRLRDVEPGELVNAPQLVVNPETGQLEVVEQVHEGEYKPYVPVIREDKRFGLHYLMKGDHFTITFKTRQNNPVELNFALRPLGEGSSLLTTQQAFDEVSW